MKTLIYQVSLGQPLPYYKICNDSVARYCERFDIDHIIQTEPILRIVPIKSQRKKISLGYLPHYEKFNALPKLNDYDTIGIFDSDIYITDNAPNIFDELNDNTVFAAVRECDMPLTSAYMTKIKKFSHGQYGNMKNVMTDWSQSYGHPFYNTGVMLWSNKLLEYLKGDTPEQFVRRKEFEKFVNGEGHLKWSFDQSMLNWWTTKTQMKRQNLDWKWNALVKAVEDKYLPQAHFIHFVLAANLPRKGAEIPDIIKNFGLLKKIKGHG